MPNSFIVVPNILPGNVTIGGNLTVSGDEIRVGAASPFTRLQRRSAVSATLSSNLAADFATRDDPTKSAHALSFDSVNNTPSFHRVNPAGTGRDEGYTDAIFTDYTAHVHTGTTTEDTIYSKVIPANTLGANGGLRVRLFFTKSAQGATASTLRVKLGATVLDTFTFANTDALLYELEFGNRNTAAQQRIYRIIFDLSVAGVASTAATTTAADTTVDQTLTITIQNGATTDSQIFETLMVHQLNSFGPV